MFFVFKVLYYADMLHVAEYGRFICNNGYIHKEHGAYPQLVKKMVKRLPDIFVITQMKEHSVNRIRDHVRCITGLRPHNPNRLSGSDQKCLKKAMEECYKKSVNVIKVETFYPDMTLDQIIPIEVLLSRLSDYEDILDYLDRWNCD